MGKFYIQENTETPKIKLEKNIKLKMHMDRDKFTTNA